MIGIINYGLGNIKAFANVYKNLNIPIRLVSNVEELEQVDKIILPGVGDFDDAMMLLDKSGMRKRLDELVMDEKMPVIGICVGMQILAKSSEEGTLPGLGWINAHVKKFESTDLINMPVPHMGWNDVQPVAKSDLLTGLENDAKFYFLHSYYFDCENKEEAIAVTHYGKQFDSIVCSGNIFGVQCHPEKSHKYGITLLKNFANL
ncbi:MAG: imidazole glycerol phosphate synthase subunit HisH [Sediminibacterium sp.]